MRFLKQLRLQGYKTFASHTDFVFDKGVTAIVGPNGSGKSNVADSLRWVLGEQSYGTLRARRTEDMIFSGSETRPRAGMASVTLTFDNSTGWLPIDFAEVEVGRRAYRSGENEYYLNGNRVRLRDLIELLGSSGLSERTYTVIGQGLIDQALSQRPEERRRLFEEAAGITVFQGKREQAVRQLEEARGNLTRARDIISELTPRLRYLKGQARRTQEYQQIKADLEAQLKVWYGYRWRLGLDELAAARARVEDSAQATGEETAALTSLLERATAVSAERNTLRDRLSQWHRESSQLHRQAEAVQRELAVRSEQHRLLAGQAEEVQRDLGRLRAALEDGAERVAAAEAELAEAGRNHEARSARVAQAEQELSERERERKAQAQRVAQAEAAVMALKTQLAGRQAQLAQLAERRSELARAEETEAQAGLTGAARVTELESTLAALEAQRQEALSRSQALEQERTVQAQALAQAQEAERGARERLTAAQRALSRLQDQRDMLSRLRDEGAGLNAGARTVQTARAQLSGIVGALGDLIEVPGELERAIEAALGGRLQDIVVRSWQDAEAAVSFLKQRQGGRATFLPLDSLRPGRGADVPRMAGVVGLASELVRFDPAIRPAVDLALNHIVVVQDLATARRLLSRDGHATLVTMDGEIVRPSGSVTGGSEGGRRDSGMLSRARALRELPGQIDAAQAQVTEIEATLKGLQAQQQNAQATIATLRARQRDAAGTAERLAGERNKAELALERGRQDRAWHAERQRQAQSELAGLDSRERELAATVEQLEAQVTGQEAQAGEQRTALGLLGTEHAMTELARLRAEAEVSATQRSQLARRLSELRNAQLGRSNDIAAKERRLTEIEAQQSEAAAVVERQGTAGQALAAEIAELARQIDPAEARLAEIEREQRNSEGRERATREQLRQTQMRQNQAELAQQRAQDELAHLRGEIEKELGLVVLEGEDYVEDQPLLPLNGMIVRLQPVAELPEGLDRDVRALRAQISRLGPVNMEAPAEYAELEARHNFLTTQAADLEQAVSSLEEVIAELDQVMQREFQQTFRAVAAQFRDEFRTLFGGGAARLVLTDPDDVNNTGIEIIARPPGKREQGLALLSGGERALTAAALIFSILKVRPTPFCVLDEVDAALDEANVGRFRDALKALSAQTQFILITHNRGTIEAADTIYGISMGTDNTSQVLSLKLDGQEVMPGSLAEAMGETAEPAEPVA